MVRRQSKTGRTQRMTSHVLLWLQPHHMFTENTVCALKIRKTGKPNNGKEHLTQVNTEKNI